MKPNERNVFLFEPQILALCNEVGVLAKENATVVIICLVWNYLANCNVGN